jgi:NTP pyrophosphatase (non-canonical NTP hydrolase)
VADETFTLNDLRKRVAKFNADRDWAQFHNPRNLAMAVSVEASELLELFLWSADDGPQPPVEARGPRVAQEMADVAICLLSLAERMDIDLTAAILEKLEMNAQKYPIEKARGRMEKSDEL